MLTIFTTPKPFRGLVDVIQRNALGSWARLDPEVEVLVIGDEQGAEQRLCAWPGGWAGCPFAVAPRTTRWAD